MTFTGVDGTMARLNVLQQSLKDRVIGKMVYDGAAVVADVVRIEIKALPTDNRIVRGGEMLSGPGDIQKKGLLESLGVTPLSDDGKGFLNVKVGFDGYNRMQTKRWPKGQPNQMIARSIERGTSFMTPNPFMKTAVAKARKRAKAAMEKTAEREVEKIMKG